MSNTEKTGEAKPKNKPTEMHPMAQQVIRDVSEIIVSLSKPRMQQAGLQMVIDQWIISGQMQTDNELHRDTYFFLRTLQESISTIREHDLSGHMPIIHEKLFYI